MSSECEAWIYLRPKVWPCPDQTSEAHRKDTPAGCPRSNQGTPWGPLDLNQQHNFVRSIDFLEEG